MFENAEPEIQRIVALTNACPERFQDKCFELLLAAYIASMAAPVAPPVPPPGHPNAATSSAGTFQSVQVPEAIRQRFFNMVKRLKLSEGSAAELFDFTADPFTYHALDLPGSSKAERTRNVALLLAMKSYLASGAWMADWKEFRAACIDHGCWDKGNANTYMNNEWFKTASNSENITLSQVGIKAADSLFGRVAGGNGGVEDSAA